MNHRSLIYFNLVKIFAILFSSIFFQLSCAPAPFQNYIREVDINKKVKQENTKNCFLTWTDSNLGNGENELQTSKSICMKINWHNKITSAQWMEAELEFIESETGVAAIPPKSWKFVPWMPSMGHGAGRPVVVEELTPSRFKASKIYFTMKGDWIIQLKVDKNVFAQSKIFFVQ